MSRKKRRLILFISIFLIGGAALVKYYFFSPPLVQYITKKVQKGNLQQTVSVTGSVAADVNTELRFESSGRVEKIDKEVGDEVKKGEIIAELEAEDEKLQLEKAQAALEAARANLALKKAGNRIEEIKVSETALEAAQVALEAAQTNLEHIKETGKENIRNAELQLKNAQIALESAENSMADAETNLNNVIATNNQAVDSAYQSLKVAMEKDLLSFFSILDDMDQILGVDKEDINDSFESSLGILKSTSLDNAQLSYKKARDSYLEIKKNYSFLGEEADLDYILSLADQFNNTFLDFDNALLKTRIVLNNSTVSASLSAETLSNFKSIIDADRITINTNKNTLETKKQTLVSADLTRKTNIDTAQASYDRAKEAYETALTQKEIAQQNLDKIKLEVENNIQEAELNVKAKEKNLANAEAAYNLKKAPPREVDIASLEAQVKEAEATLALARQNLEKTILKAPIDGIITNIYKEVGENIALGEVFGVMISPQLIIEADVSEADIDKVKIGQKVDITFDAFSPDEHFTGQVFFIDPAETKIQDVIYYKIKVSLGDRKGKAIRSGMTANLEILTAKKDNVLYIPERAVLEEGGQNIVRVLTEKGIQKVPVRLGLRADEGLVEVKSGLREGQEVILSIVNKK